MRKTQIRLPLELVVTYIGEGQEITAELLLGALQQHGKVSVGKPEISFSEPDLQRFWVEWASAGNVEVTVEVTPFSQDEQALFRKAFMSEGGAVYLADIHISEVAKSLGLPERLSSAFLSVHKLEGVEGLYRGEGYGKTHYNLSRLVELIDSPDFRRKFEDVRGTGPRTFELLVEFLQACRRNRLLDTAR